MRAWSPRTALVPVDLQHGISWMLGADAIADPLANAARLAAAFRSRHPSTGTGLETIFAYLGEVDTVDAIVNALRNDPAAQR